MAQPSPVGNFGHIRINGIDLLEIIRGAGVQLSMPEKIPAGAKLAGIGLDWTTNTILIRIESPELPAILPGQLIPVVCVVEAVEQ